MTHFDFIPFYFFMFLSIITNIFLIMTHLILIAIFLFIVDVILIAGVLIAMQKEKQYKNWKKNFYSLTKNKNNVHN